MCNRYLPCPYNKYGAIEYTHLDLDKCQINSYIQRNWEALDAISAIPSLVGNYVISVQLKQLIVQ